MLFWSHARQSQQGRAQKNFGRERREHRRHHRVQRSVGKGRRYSRISRPDCLFVSCTHSHTHKTHKLIFAFTHSCSSSLTIPVCTHTHIQPHTTKHTDKSRRSDDKKHACVSSVCPRSPAAAQCGRVGGGAVCVCARSRCRPRQPRGVVAEGGEGRMGRTHTHTGTGGHREGGGGYALVLWVRSNDVIAIACLFVC